MAVYKVPQDVEAEDKLIGPFSFKQFIFLIITVAALAIAYGLAQLLLPLALIPLPVAIFFGTLALPLRKDQPMEVYMAAIISFMLKPKVRLWQPDGIEALIEVIAPKNEDKTYGKGYSQEEVQKRLSYLANIVDSRGWSVRGLEEPDSSMRADLYNEAQAMDDLLDDQGSRAQQIDDLLAKTDIQRRQQLINQMQHQPVQQIAQPMIQPSPASPAQPNPQTTLQPAQQYTTTVEQIQPATPIATTEVPVSPLYTPMSIVQPEIPEEDIKLVVNPYPNMNQSVITPLSEQPQQPSPAPTPVQPQPAPAAAAPAPQTTSSTPVSPAIIDLASNHNDLSIETLQREAKRIQQKEQESEEVVISLR